MVPFSFEKLARSASLDAPSVYPLSDAARATHESFESHLQRAATTGRDQSTSRSTREEEVRKQSESSSREPPRNEHSNQTANEAHRDGADDRQAKESEASLATESSKEHEADDTQQDAAKDEAVIAIVADEPHAPIQNAALDVSADSDSKPDKSDSATLDGEQTEAGATRVANAKAAVDRDVQKSRDERVASHQANRDNSDLSEASESDAQVRPVISSDATVATDVRLKAEAQVSDNSEQGAEPSKANATAQRRGNRSDAAANQVARETADAATKAVALDVIEAVQDTASEDDSRQPHNRKDSDSSQPIGNVAAEEPNTTTSAAPSRFAQHLLGRTDNSAARTPSITDADQARFVDRVARAVQATGERGGTLRLRLSPPELGALTLEVKVHGGAISARVEADTPAARSLLIDNLPVLRERLAEHGMRVDQFDVDLSDRHTGGTPDGLQQNDQQQQDRPRARTPVHEPDDTSPTSSGTTPIKIGNEQLNIIV